MRNQQVEKIGKQISILYRQIQKYINRQMQPYGLTYSDHAFLIHISRNPGINQRQLARYLAVDEAVVTRVLKRLDESGFVQRARAPEDMRSFCLHLTQRGGQLIPALINTFQELDQMLAGGFDMSELTALCAGLEKMTGNACIANAEEN